jgi:hypothetical protein
VAPLSPARYKVQFTIGVATLEKLRLAKDMLRHAIPTGDEASILDRALTVLLADLARKKFAATDRPRQAEAVPGGSRHVPAEVRRAVWQRDLGRCAFVAHDGRRCAQRSLLEFHHVEPYAIGGEATVANIQLRCRAHNGFESRRVFGPARREPVAAASAATVGHQRTQPIAHGSSHPVVLGSNSFRNEFGQSASGVSEATAVSAAALAAHPTAAPRLAGADVVDTAAAAKDGP